MSKHGARKTGGTAGRKRAADSAMAARMKENGEQRKTLRCAVCNKIVSMHNFPDHIRVGCK